jgi:hypothetical protein
VAVLNKTVSGSTHPRGFLEGAPRCFACSNSPFPKKKEFTRRASVGSKEAPYTRPAQGVYKTRQDNLLKRVPMKTVAYETEGFRSVKQYELYVAPWPSFVFCILLLWQVLRYYVGRGPSSQTPYCK